MHGLIFRTIEAFVSDSFGPEVWGRAVTLADLEVSSFEAMLQYDAAHLAKLLHGCAQALDRPHSVLLEDMGSYLVTHQHHASIRRLMRFGGDTYADLLRALDELPGRTRLAVSGLELPRIDVRESVTQKFTIQCRGDPLGFGHVLVGLLRAMADDYGTLAVLEHQGVRDRTEVITVTIVEAAFADDRGFSLVAAGAGQST